MTDIYALGTFTEGDGPRWPGIIRDGRVVPLAALLPDAPADLGSIFADWSQWNEQIHAAVTTAPDSAWRNEADFIAHLPFRTDNLFGAGANYRRHVIDLIVDKGAGGVEHLDHDACLQDGVELMDRRAASGKPFVWIGLRSAIAGPARPLLLPYDVKEPDWELELAVVIGKSGRRISRGRALDHVVGYTIANDVTARELVDRADTKQMGMDWLASKNSPGFHILGPYITPARFVPDPQKLHIPLSLNGQVMQDEGTDDIIFTIARLIEFISAHVQLHAGDMIMTGSPSGNGTHYGRFLRDGDVMVGEVDGIVGAQVVRCVVEQQPA
jgi:2-keto-4-pentenoate hydratase/2-oxohepta-3-ene-1,7-dioic acid hydratase in catechol pathway